MGICASKQGLHDLLIASYLIPLMAVHDGKLLVKGDSISVFEISWDWRNIGLTGDPMEANRLKHLYVEELKDLYSAESQMVKALPKMAKAATSDELRAGFEEHLEQTKGHVVRLEGIFKALGESPKGKKCKGMEGLIKEGAEMIDEDPAPEELDAGLISAAQRVEHYEIAGYGCVATYAKLLGEHPAESLLRQTLEEEKETDKKLTELSGDINLEAAGSAESNGEELRGNNGRRNTKAARA
jgi:ferritin-like metal-binding protein YciE